MSKGVALVTGAAQGIGRAIALRLANDGFDLAVNGTVADERLEKLVEEIQAIGRKALIVAGDVTLEDTVAGIVAETVKVLGGLDVMVANAGIVETCPLVDLTVEAFDRSYAINGRATMLCYKHAAKQMIEQGRGGRIIGACSISGKRGQPTCAAYSASKFAVRGLTQSAASELGKFGITVNAYAPGPTVTPMLRAQEAVLQQIGVPVYAERMKQMSAVGFVGEADDIASLVSYLASKESRFITGQTILCDGGMIFD